MPPVKAGNKIANQTVKDLAVQAIESLKQRKARPDQYRVIHFMRKHNGVSNKEATDALEQLTDEHRIVRLGFNGSVSYRHVSAGSRPPAAKNIGELSVIKISDDRLFNIGGAAILNSDRASAAIQRAVRTIIAGKSTEPDLAKFASLSELEEYFRNHEKFTNSSVAVAVKREVNCGHLTETDVCKYMINHSGKPAEPAVMKPPSALRKESATAFTQQKHGVQIAVGRDEHAKRIKKTKVIFDPSDEPSWRRPPPAKRARQVAPRTRSPPAAAGEARSRDTPSPAPAAAAAQEKPPAAPKRRWPCDFCEREKHEAVLTCQECLTPAHPSCLGYSRRLARRVREEAWTCLDCRTCVECSSAGGELIFCDECDVAYHLRCHEPPVRQRPAGEWVCRRCSPGSAAAAAPAPATPPSQPAPRRPGRPGRPPGSKNRHPSSSAAARRKQDAKRRAPGGTAPAAAATDHSPHSRRPGRPPQRPPAPPAPETLSWPARLMAEPEDPAVPDASGWSAEQVAAYFSRHGFQEHAAAFQKHEVDGTALLLMSRQDVLRGIGLKLGPALKIYNHVKLLQTRRRGCLDFCLL